MNQHTSSKLLVGLFWLVGMPMFVLGDMYGVPKALLPGSPLSRAAWGAIPAVGLAVAIACIATLWRRHARGGGAVFDRRWYGRYYVEVLIATIVYIALSIACALLLKTIADSTLRILVGLVPSVGIALIILAMVRWVMRADEFQRKGLLESFAVVAAITGLWTWSYGILEIVGLPRLSMLWVWPVMVALWIAWSGARAMLRR